MFQTIERAQSMKVEAYFDNETEKRQLDAKLNTWTFYNTFGGHLHWRADGDHFVIEGSAVCDRMVSRLSAMVNTILIS